ncbi:hypothetical protein V6N13_063672 [Hibiscus sabdariffa]
MEGSVTHNGDMFKLTADNFSYWKPMMEDHLYCKDLYEPITFQTMPEGKIEREWELLNRKAVAMIRKYIDKSLFEHVSTYTNAYELWSKLESMIQKKTPRNKAHLVRRLVKLEYNDGQSMIEHLNNFKGLVNQLSKIEMKIDDELQALLLLSSLQESWDTLVVTLSNSAPDGTLTTDTISDSLMNEEARRKERDLPSQSEANVVENRGRSNNRIKNENQGRSKTRECRSLKRDQKIGTVKCDQVDPKKKEENSTTAVAAKEEEDGIFLFGGDNYLNLAQDDCSWIVDSGASFHTIEDTKQSRSPVSKAITQIIQDPMPVIRHETIEEQNAENQDENNDSPTDESSTEANEDQPIETIGPEVAPEPEVTPQSELRRSGLLLISPMHFSIQPYFCQIKKNPKLEEPMEAHHSVSQNLLRTP